MKFLPKNPVRKFVVGVQSIILSDCGNLMLDADEQITILRKSGAEYDFASKEWGFYATPSTNGRLIEFGFRTAVVRNITSGRRYVLVIEKGFEELFFKYLEAEKMVVELWLDE